MNRKMVFNTLGRMSLACAACLLLPAVVSLIYGEQKSMQSFIVVSAGAALLGFLLLLIFKSKNHVIYAKEGFAIAALSWIGMSAIGALPFVISGAIPNYVNAFFETVSGFTTTGASILEDVETLSHGMHFWRSFTHWLGGMGVIVLLMAVVRNVSDRSIHLMRAEMPGPAVGKLVPKARDTAKILYYIYIVLTLTEVAFLWAGDMNLFEALVHTFGTAGTGGFSIKNASIGAYSSYSQIVVTVFMLMFGINFNLYYLLLMRKLRTVLKSSELQLYLSLFVIGAAIITWNISSLYATLGEAIKDSTFSVSSIITTTGYTTTDMNAWPSLSKGILLVLMCIGSCAGSTAGGIKVSRVILIFKQITREVRHMLHPRSVNAIKFEEKDVDEATQKSVTIYLAFYVLCLITAFLLISWERFGFETNLTATISCFNNIGPFFGTQSCYANYSAFSKIVLSAMMMLGRLEIFPLIIGLSPATWKK